MSYNSLKKREKLKKHDITPLTCDVFACAFLGRGFSPCCSPSLCPAPPPPSPSPSSPPGAAPLFSGSPR